MTQRIEMPNQRCFVRLTETERHDRIGVLLAIEGAREEAELRLESAKLDVKDAKQAVDEIETERRDIASALAAGYETRPVACTGVVDIEAESIAVYRDDTGDRIFGRRASADELRAAHRARQGVLPLGAIEHGPRDTDTDDDPDDDDDDDEGERAAQ